MRSDPMKKVLETAKEAGWRLRPVKSRVVLYGPREETVVVPAPGARCTSKGLKNALAACRRAGLEV